MINHKNYYFDPINKNLFFKDQLINLSIKEKILLDLLFEAKGKIVSFEILDYYIWPHNPVSTSSRRTLIYRLRKKLKNELIETIPAFGYKLTLAL